MVKKKTNILLLGGGGFLGRALSEGLCRGGWIVHIISPHFLQFVGKNVVFHKGSLDNKKILNETLKVCDCVIHVASTTTPGDSINDPTIEVAQNVLPTIRFIDHFSGYKNKRLIYISSGGAIYDPPRNRQIKETDSLKPLSYYGAGKLSVEFFLKALSNTGNQKIVVLRPSNLYGPKQPYQKGFGLIRTILEKIETGKKVEVWGDGRITRDYLFIDDMVRIVEKILDHSDLEGTFNVGTGIGHSINEVLLTIKNICKKEIEIKYIEDRIVDIESVVLDISKIKKEIEWTPQVTLESGIQKTWQWFNEK